MGKRRRNKRKREQEREHVETEKAPEESSSDEKIALSVDEKFLKFALFEQPIEVGQALRYGRWY